MKVLIVNTYDGNGGAANGAYHLYKSLRGVGIDSEMLVQFKSGTDPTVKGPANKIAEKINWAHFHLDRSFLDFYPKRSKAALFSPGIVGHSGIVSAINNSDADIVHLHWVAGGMLSAKDIGQIRKPVVWTLHDMWPFTGGCHYSGNCIKYKEFPGCGKCPQLHSDNEWDISARGMEYKINSFKKLKSITFVALSDWIKDCTHSGRLPENIDVVKLPALLDTKAFSPMDKQEARSRLDLPQDKKIIIFGGNGMVQDSRKGFSYLDAALRLIITKNTRKLVFGSDNFISTFGCYCLGQLKDDAALRVAYSAADVCVMPSVQEVLGFVAVESMASGTPAVVFDMGGQADIVDHKTNGFKAWYKNPTSLAEGIDWVLNYPDPETLRQNARDAMVRKYDSVMAAGKYKELYKKILEG
jgi:glycosyltransferase involved in cell wall biosynthesis